MEANNHDIKTNSQKYNELVIAENMIRKDPRVIKAMTFNKIEGENNSDADKYNNTVELLYKVKEFVKDSAYDFLIDFEVDYDNYPAATISFYGGESNIGKIFLWKSTYGKPDYIKFELTARGECKIKKIFSQEVERRHKAFMFDAFMRGLERYNNSLAIQKIEDYNNPKTILTKIIADLEENDEQDKTRYINYLIKKGFTFNERGVFHKQV